MFKKETPHGFSPSLYPYIDEFVQTLLEIGFTFTKKDAILSLQTQQFGASVYIVRGGAEISHYFHDKKTYKNKCTSWNEYDLSKGICIDFFKNHDFYKGLFRKIKIDKLMKSI